MSSLRHPHRQAFARMFALQTVTEAGAASAATDLADIGSLDEYTGLPDGTGFRRAFQRHALHALRSHDSLTLALLGLDPISAIGPAHRRAAFETSVLECSRRLGEAFRGSDFLARWRDDEFAVLFPRTQLAGGLRAVEKAMRAICASTAPTASGAAVELSFSAGVVAVTPAAPFSEIVEQAGQLLCRARQGGRARIGWPEGEFGVVPRRVVLITDDEDFGGVLGGGFGDEGLEVLPPSSDTVAAAEQAAAGLILLDLDAFDGCGWQVLSRMRGCTRLQEVPILVISSESDDVVRSFHAGADDFVPRSAKAEELLARADRLMRRRPGVSTAGSA